MPGSIEASSAEQLRSWWRDPACDRFLREEALWEYWRRVAEGLLPFSRDELVETLSLANARIADVLGLLAQRDRLSDDLIEAAIAFEAGNPSAWLANQLRARALLPRLASGAPPNEAELQDTLVAKGTSWAALEAVRKLPAHLREAVVRASEERRVFSRRQRHELRLCASQGAMDSD